MKSTIDTKLLARELGEKRSHTSIKTIYGDRAWVDDLDIINELGGHTGCVNALSWSKSGRLLASGSDDTHLNIWSYNPDSLAKPFSLNTSVSTGHTQNIFSVKFMPHSNDRTVITCAGDSQVRVFDIEYGGSYDNISRDTAASANTRSRRFNNFFSGARFLNDGNTNARVYRSHSDRVKRIVTESSPHMFLTCSEDGEVRQWDLRQPSSAYPSPAGARGLLSYQRGHDEQGSTSLPPPLISYKNYTLDLNSISCSGSQPQYIALGGAHLHCFLHDRRMLGRSAVGERGQPTGQRVEAGSHEDDLMAEATRCVKRFAPNERRKMGTHDNGHITACKISDANPNEMVASWSGDHIYSFDLVKSPDARDKEAEKARQHEASLVKLRDQKDRKRKRVQATTSETSLKENARSKARLAKTAAENEGDVALRVRYGNGQSEDITINPPAEAGGSTLEYSQDILLTEAQKLSERVARALVKLRKTMFDFATPTGDATSLENSTEISSHRESFTSVLGQAASLLPQMDEIIRDWSYPMDPTPEDVTLQQTLRRNRQASWRFVQASGCLARTMGGKIQTLSPAGDPRLSLFQKVTPAAREGNAIDDDSRFNYDFLRAILLWLNGGPPSLADGFRRPLEVSRESRRYLLETGDNVEASGAINDKILPYLLALARDDKPVVNLDSNRFERDELRYTFGSQKQAVEAFSRAVKDSRLPRVSASAASPEAETSSAEPRMHSGATFRFWGIRVGRALLMDAGEGVNYEFVNRAFGGLRLSIRDEEVDELERSQEEIHPDEEEEVVEAVDLVVSHPEEGIAVREPSEPLMSLTSAADSRQTAMDTTGGSTRSDADTTAHVSINLEGGDVQMQEADDDEDGDDNETSDSDGDQSNDSDDDEGSYTSRRLFRRTAAFGRSRERASVNAHVPYTSHTRVYAGHCNTKTVKDVNYFGLNDEYVMSGSDSGHLFIWDKKSTQVVNILEGDGEVVNVVTGHPYEPMIACSGIDSTVKIFGTDAVTREDAEKGVNIANPGGGGHSSLRLGVRRRRASQMQDEPSEGDAASAGGLPSRRAMHRGYEIMSQNDLDRRSGVGDAFITRGMLARLAATINQGQMAGGNGTGGIVIDDNCAVM